MTEQQQCSICKHPECASIDDCLRRGIPHRQTAARFNVGRASVARHALKHLSAPEDTSVEPKIRKALKTVEVQLPPNAPVSQRLEELCVGLRRWISTIEKSKTPADRALVPPSYRVLRDIFRDLALIRGELKETPDAQVNIQVALDTVLRRRELARAGNIAIDVQPEQRAISDGE